MVGIDRVTVLGEDQIYCGEYANLDWVKNESKLQKVFKFRDFSEAFVFMTKVAEIAEELDHHPDWFNSWNTVEISVTNHQAGGVTEIDLFLCRKIDETAKLWVE